MATDSVQLDLIAGYYHCDNCERMVARVRRTRRFRLCDECWRTIVPDYIEIPTQDGVRSSAWMEQWSQERERIAAYWEWHHAMEAKHPPHYTAPKPIPDWRTAMAEPDSLNPLCACGRQREPMKYMAAGATGLFGGPFRSQCAVCEGKAAVKVVFNAAAKIHPDWNDEDWLEDFWQRQRNLYDIGVLPDYWFELREGSESNGPPTTSV